MNIVRYAPLRDPGGRLLAARIAAARRELPADVAAPTKLRYAQDLAMALAFEPTEPGVMKRPPRAAGEPILSAFLIWRIALVSVLFCAGIFGQYELALMTGADLETTRTMAVNTLVVMEIFYLFSIRYIHGTSFSLRGIVGTPAVLIAVATVTLLQFLSTYAPFMEVFFESRALGTGQGIQVIVFGVALLVVLEVEKAIVRRVRAVAG